MPARQTLPTIWLITDERLGEQLWEAIGRVPEGGGVVLRHHRGDQALGERVAAACAARGLMLAVAGDVALARAVGAAMIHNPVGDTEGLLVSRSVHDAREAVAAQSANMCFVSPVFGTTSHAGVEGLGIERALALAQMAGIPAIALGGMDANRGAVAMAAGFDGWAGIDAFLRS